MPTTRSMRSHTYDRSTAFYEASGATRVILTQPYLSTHNLGTNRMSAKALDGVVDRNGRAHDVPNLYASDGSQFTTGASKNPMLTIVALAIRQADHIAVDTSHGNL